MKRVRAKQGSPGIDGMTVDELPEYLGQHWPAIRERLLSGTYEPKPVKRVEIPKPDGGVRKLGIPTVLDRFVQQAVQQVLHKQWDPTFSEHSYGFRAGRSAKQAVAQAQQYIAEGCGGCVDLIGRSFSIESTTTNRWERSPNGTGPVYKGLARLFRLLRNARGAETFGFVGQKACAMRFLATGEDRPQAVCGTGLAGRERGDGGENRLVPMRPVAREPEPGSGPSPVKCLSRLVWTSVIGRRPIA